MDGGIGKHTWVISEGFLPPRGGRRGRPELASVPRSDVPVVVQHTRLDAREGRGALMTSLAWAAGEGT